MSELTDETYQLLKVDAAQTGPTYWLRHNAISISSAIRKRRGPAPALMTATCCLNEYACCVQVSTSAKESCTGVVSGDTMRVAGLALFLRRICNGIVRE